MNPSIIPPEQQVEASWETNLNRQDSATGPDIGRPFSGRRLDWDWDNPMILTQHPGGGSNDNADRKSSVSRSGASNVCAYTCILSSGFPSNFSQNPRGIFHSPGIRSFSSMGSTSISTLSGLDGLPRSANVTGIPGLAPTSADHGDGRSFFGERQRHYFGLMSSESTGQMNDFTVKRETEVSGSDGNGARIGLNLGVRTYFSTEDTAAGRLGKRHRAQSPGSQVPTCQAEGCKSDLRIAKHYHRRHKVCELHSKAANVIAAGFTQRFCQQCSRFHLLSEFDEGKRSCRKRLADHNRRRRKPQPPTGCAGGTPCSALMGKNDEHLSCMFVSTDPKSTLKRFKTSGSRSSASFDDSDDLTGSAETTFHIHTCAALDTANAIGPYSQPCSTPLSDAQALVSALSTATAQPVLCMHQNVNHHLSVFSGNSQEAAVYNQFLNQRSRHGDPNLSFASVGGMRFGSKIEQNSGQSYHRVDHPVPWLRPFGTLSDSQETLSRPMSLQPLILGMKPAGSNEENVSACSLSSVLEYSTPAQSCLPAVLSRDVSGSEWIIGNQDNRDQFGPSSLNIMTRGLEISGAPLAGALVGQQRGLGILSLHGSEVLDDSHEDGPDLKFPDLQLLRPGTFAPSVYDSDNIL